MTTPDARMRRLRRRVHFLLGVALLNALVAVALDSAGQPWSAALVVAAGIPAFMVAVWLVETEDGNGGGQR